MNKENIGYKYIMANTNFKIAAGVTLLVIALLIVIAMRRQQENHGVFSHRGTLHGTKNQVRNHYTLQELDDQNPSDYWSDTSQDMSIYDKHIKSYNAKRFDPRLTQ